MRSSWAHAGELPLLPESVRYWGTDLLVPLGFRADPELPEGAIRRVVGAGDGDLVVLDEEGFELIARDAFKPLSRAGIRLARGGLLGAWAVGGKPDMSHGRAGLYLQIPARILPLVRRSEVGAVR